MVGEIYFSHSGVHGHCLIPYLSLALLAFLVVVFAYALAEHLQLMGRWLERPYLFVFPVIGIGTRWCWRSASEIATTSRHSTWSP